MRTIILHYHLFKNAGTSLDAVLKNNFRDAWVTREFPATSRPEGNTAQVAAWIRDTPGAVAFSSHTMMGPLPQIDGVRIVSVMLLRDPVERIRSVYRFEKIQESANFGPVLAKHTTFDGYVRVRLALPHDRQCRNFQTQRLAYLLPGPESELVRAKQAMRRLTVCGLVAEFTDVLSRLAEAVAGPFPDFVLDNVHANRTETAADKEGDHVAELLAESNSDDLALLQAFAELRGGGGGKAGVGL